MNYLMSFSLFLFGCASASRYELPKTWENGFSISYYHGGGMAYESTNIVLSKDSCVYTEMENGKDTVKRFSLSEKELEEVLNKMRTLEITKVRTKKQSLIHDKATTKLCFSKGGNDEYCLASGATEGLHQDDYKRFNEACEYLLGLAKNK